MPLSALTNGCSMQDADPSALAPDITIPSTLDDFLAGRDPVLEAALHHDFQ